MKRHLQIIARLGFFGVMLVALVKCEHLPESKENLADLVYFEETPVPLDVAEVLVIQDSPTLPSPGNSEGLFSDIHPVIENWFAKSFVAKGKKGKAFIRIKNVKVIQDHIRSESQIYSLINTGGPSRYGADVAVSIEIMDTDAYKKGGSTTKMYREVIITSDINVSFHQSLWVNFMKKFMQAFQQQFVLDCKKNIPNVLKEKP